MPAERKVKLKLPQRWALALHEQCNVQIHYYEPADEHGHLLLEHVVELFNKLDTKLTTEPAPTKVTIKLTHAEALAFMQFWKQVPMQAGTLLHVAIQDIMGDIDQESKRPRPQLELTNIRYHESTGP